jgi:NADH-quinone oxidoreductase subunit F
MHPLEKHNLVGPFLNSLEEYKANGGLKGLEKARAMPREQVIAEIKKSNLRGRGGAGFPTAIKWDTVSKAPDPKKYLVCNFAEGEPGTYKDRYFLEKNPYIVLEGMLIGAYAINAKQAIIGTKKKFKHIVPRMEKAIAEFEQAGICEKGYLKLVLGPDAYLFGEEKALLEVIDGRAPMPRFFPPFLVGVYAGPGETNPAVVNNAESLSHVAKIMANGADWFKSMGNEDTPGTLIFTLTGDLKRPGMYEVPAGLTVRQLLYDLGGGPRDEKFPLKAVFSGVASRVMTPDQFDLKADFGTLRNAGVGVGSAGFMVYDESRCMVQVAHMFSHFLAFSSCGQCIPCNSGTRVITEHLRNLLETHGSQSDLEEIVAEAGRCTNQTRCFLPQQESVLITSILKKFPQEFKAHVNKACSLSHAPLQILKVQNFDDKTGQFTIEEHPIEFAEAFWPGM